MQGERAGRIAIPAEEIGAARVVVDSVVRRSYDPHVSAVGGDAFCRRWPERLPAPQQLVGRRVVDVDSFVTANNPQWVAIGSRCRATGSSATVQLDITNLLCIFVVAEGRTVSFGNEESSRRCGHNLTASAEDNIGDRTATGEVHVHASDFDRVQRDRLNTVVTRPNRGRGGDEVAAGVVEIDRRIAGIFDVEQRHFVQHHWLIERERQRTATRVVIGVIRVAVFRND